HAPVPLLGRTGRGGRPHAGARSAITASAARTVGTRGRMTARVAGCQGLYRALRESGRPGKAPPRARVARRAALGYGARMSKSGDVVVALLLVLAAATAVSAGDANPCRDDVVRLCADVTPGEGRVRDCIRAHAKELSPGCSARLRTADQLSQAGRLDP